METRGLMAWMDDRVWCHPKFTDLSAEAFRTYWCSVAYSSGMSTKGVLTSAQQVLVGTTAVLRTELVDAGLWEVPDNSGGVIHIHDWAEHNGKRDARKEADRLRKRAARAREREDSPQERPQDKPVDGPQDVHTLKEVKEVTTPISPSGKTERSVTSMLSERCPDCGETFGAGCLEDCPRLAAAARRAAGVPA